MFYVGKLASFQFLLTQCILKTLVNWSPMLKFRYDDHTFYIKGGCGFRNPLRNFGIRHACLICWEVHYTTERKEEKWWTVLTEFCENYCSFYNFKRNFPKLWPWGQSDSGKYKFSNGQAPRLRLQAHRYGISNCQIFRGVHVINL